MFLFGAVTSGGGSLQSLDIAGSDRLCSPLDGHSAYREGVARPPYLPFMHGTDRDPRSGAFRWRMGIRPLDLAQWFEWGTDSSTVLAEKERLNQRYPDTVFAVLDDVEAEATEVAEAIATFVGAPLRDDLHPLDAAARLVPEDLVLMVERPGADGPELRFGGGSVCFPNRWDLRSKLGLTMAEVHAPVARLNDQLAVPVDRFFDRLRPDRSYWRLGWGILDTADWYTPIDGTAAPRPADLAPEEMFLRVERETLRRFPATNCVLFTIRTYVAPLDTVVTPAARSRLAVALEAMPDDVRGYKDLAHTAEGIVAHLQLTVPRT